ncbi:MAG: hypothetical protein Q7O66_17525 [Dehalococcoidia bacterium]|nr:hypothetical protein [Dehalococcoidia bacterium]
MSEELGRIERLPVDSYKSGRKLLFVPLVFAPPEPPDDLSEIINRYWGQVRTQITKLEDKLGSLAMIFHELIPVGGEDGIKAIEELNKGSHEVARLWTAKGVRLEPIEDGELLAEFMDWGKCLSIGLQSQVAFTKIYESYAEANKKRNEHMAKQIDEMLKDDEIGILLMREGHQLQFPPSIQVFYVAPPSLDEIKRWSREHDARTRSMPE